MLMIKNNFKIKKIAIVQLNKEVLHIAMQFRIQYTKKIPVTFHDGSSYQFTIKVLEKNFEGESRCLGENTDKYKTFSVPIKKGAKIIN